MRNPDDNKTIAWADVAKAACVCLIVMMHGEAQVATAGWEDQSKIIEIWHVINEFIRPIRLPTFFMISGLLTAKFILQSRVESDDKLFIRPMYLYVVWGMVLVMLIPHYPAVGFGGISISERLVKIVFVGSPAWYLFALAIFYLIAKVTRGVPVGPVLIGCALLSIVGSIWLPSNVIYAAKLPRCLFFFVAGVRLKDAIAAFADSANLRRNAILLCAYTVSAVGTMDLGTYLLPVDVLAVAFSVTTWSLLTRKLGWLAAPVRWIGRRTLLIYLLHFPLICLLSVLVSHWIDPQLRENFWLGLLYPIMATLLVVPASLALGTFMQRRGLGLMFDLPASLSQVGDRRRAEAVPG